MNLSPRLPPRLKKIVRTLGQQRVRRSNRTVIWLHTINGDPVTGREKREYRREIYQTDDEEDLKDDKIEIEVEIENPTRRAMPLSYLEGLSEIHFGVTKQVSTDEMVATRWEIIGMHTGDLLGVPPTRREVTFTGMTLLEFEEPIVIDDVYVLRATNEWTFWDLPGLLDQIGAKP
jgi:predicted ester cyclase